MDLVREASLTIFNKYCNYFFIKYELNQFEWNECLWMI